jgi:putative transcriptional regulator
VSGTAVAASRRIRYYAVAMSEQDETPRWLGGCFLVSDFDLVDPNFHRAVILMIDHDEEGAFGLVVNRPSPFTLGEVVEGMDDSPASSIPVYVGGPVQQNALFVLHEEPDAGDGTEDAAEQPVEGVAFEPATQPLMDWLKGEWGDLPEAERPAVRVYVGYSGWASGQLEGELEADAWVVLRATREIVFHPDPRNAWAEALARTGPLYQIILLTGFKPSMN